jgi:Predicted permeases
MKQYAFGLIVFAAILSSISGLLVKYMQIPATSMASIRMATPVILVSMWLLWRGKPLFRHGYRTMLYGSVLNALRMWFFFNAFIYTTMSNAIIVLYTWPIFATILGVFFLKEQVNRMQLLSLMISFVGILIVYWGFDFSLEDNDFIGLTAGVLCAFFYACSIVIFKSKSSDFDPWETIFFQNLIGAIIFLPMLLINTPAPRPMDWTLALTHGVVIGIIMFAFFFYGLRHIAASKASMVSYLEVISALILGHLVFGDQLTTQMIIGAAIIMSSTLALRMSISR